jgi:hypothetical protein
VAVQVVYLISRLVARSTVCVSAICGMRPSAAARACGCEAAAPARIFERAGESEYARIRARFMEFAFVAAYLRCFPRRANAKQRIRTGLLVLAADGLTSVNAKPRTVQSTYAIDPLLGVRTGSSHHEIFANALCACTDREEERRN